MTGNKKINIQYGLRRIKDLSFFINEHIEVSPEKISIDFKLYFAYDIKNDQMDLTLEVNFLEDNIQVFMSGKVLTSFVIKDLAKFKNEEGNIDLPDKIMTTFFSISITHTRALMAKAAMGSKFNGLYIPIINNPAHLLKELMKQEGQETLK